MTWPDHYVRKENSNIWVSCPATIDIIAACKEKARLANEYRESTITIKCIKSDDKNTQTYYFVYVEFVDADEAFFILQESI